MAWSDRRSFLLSKIYFRICPPVSCRSVDRYTDSISLNPAAGRGRPYIKGSLLPSLSIPIAPCRISRPTLTRSYFLPLLRSLSWLVPLRPPLTVSVRRCRHCNTCPTSSVLDWRMQLNNFLQVNGGTTRLQYLDVPSGPAHKPTWHCTAYSKYDVSPLWRSLTHLISRWRSLCRWDWQREG